MKKTKVLQSTSGQALIETALILPILLTVVLNAVNFAFFFLVALNITSSSRTSGIYSIMGGATPAAMALPTSANVTDLAQQDLTGALSAPTTKTGVNVCSSTIGTSGTGASTVTTCTSTGIGGGYPTSADADPEAPDFLMGRVDVAYQFSPPIPLTPFNALLLLATNCSSSGGTVTCTFYRHIVMR